MNDKNRPVKPDAQSMATRRELFESWLRKTPDARFWNTTDAMFAAWNAALAQQAGAEVVAALKACIAALERTGHCIEADRLAAADKARAALAATPAPEPQIDKLLNDFARSCAFGEFEDRVRTAAAIKQAMLAKPVLVPEFDSLPDDAIDNACAAGAIYRVDFMRVWEELRRSLAAAQAKEAPGRVDCGECPNVTFGCESGHCLKAHGGS